MAGAFTVHGRRQDTKASHTMTNGLMHQKKTWKTEIELDWHRNVRFEVNWHGLGRGRTSSSCVAQCVLDTGWTQIRSQIRYYSYTKDFVSLYWFIIGIRSMKVPLWWIYDDGFTKTCLWIFYNFGMFSKSPVKCCVFRHELGWFAIDIVLEV